MMKDWKTIYSVKGPKNMMEMTAVELMEAMKETKTIILSFGAIENHGAHLPLGADYYQAEALIRCTYEALLEKGHKTIPGFSNTSRPSSPGVRPPAHSRALPPPGVPARERSPSHTPSHPRRRVPDALHF